MDTKRMSRSARALGVVATVAALLLATTACQPRPPAKDKVVIFVHGWSAFGAGNDCRSTFGSLESKLVANGFTADMVTVAFYDSDTNCDVSLADWGNISNSTSWKDLSKAFSTYVYETYTSKGIAVDLVGHSMGGLIIRGAVNGSTHAQAGFSAPLKVEDVVTFAAPHAGAAWYSHGCFWGQCSGLKPGNADLEWLATDANPQGVGGTEWTVIGSTNDDVVPTASALSMGVPAERKVTYTSLEHSDYMGNATAQARAIQALAEAGA